MAKAIRDAFGETLAELGGKNPDIVVLDADLSSSTKTALFGKKFPDRFFNMGIAEANMIGTAAGLATTGKIPFASTFAVFLTTLGLISIRTLICYGNANVKLAGAYGGMSDAYDGATHHANEDIAVMRSLPNMRVICVCDEAQTRWATEYAANTDGPFYIRLSREAMPEIYGGARDFEFGKGNIVRQGKDITVIACGIMVHKAVEAAESLSQRGIDVRVVDMHTIKPIDSGLIAKCARETGAIVTAEEHSIYGGLGSAVSEVVAAGGMSIPFSILGIRDTFTESGAYGELMKKYGLDPKSLEAEIIKTLNKKNTIQ